MANGKPTYAGSITSAGAQIVKAPLKTTANKGKATVKTGSDLRTGK